MSDLTFSMNKSENSMNVFNFEDDLFEVECKATPIRSAVSFLPRNYRPTDGNIDSKLMTDRKLYKYHADYLYFSGEYVKALEAYENLEILFSDNSFMTRAVQESRVWCLLKTDRATEALTIAEKLNIEANTFEQQMGSRYLLNIINGKIESPETILSHVQQSQVKSSASKSDSTLTKLT